MNSIEKILIVAPGPRYSTYDVFKYYTGAITQIGYTVKTFNYHDWFNYYLMSESAINELDEGDPNVQRRALALGAQMMLSTMARFMPDHILMISAIALPSGMYDWIEEFRKNVKKRITTSVIFTESPYISDVELRILERVDMGMVMDKNTLPKFLSVNERSMYLPHAFSNDVHFPRMNTGNNKADVFMVGTGFPERVELLSNVDWDGIDLKLFGNWTVSGIDIDGMPLSRYIQNEYLDNEQEVPLWYSGSKVSLNAFRTARWPGDVVEHIGANEAYSASPRCFEIMACGGFLMTNPRPELSDIFEPEKDLVYYEGPEELEDKVKFYLANEDARNAVKLSAVDSVRPHSYLERARAVTKFIGENHKNIL